MKQSLILLIFAITAISSYGQNNTTKSEQFTTDAQKITNSIRLDETRIEEKNFSRDSYVHTEANYTDATGKGIIIQNSYPRGNGLIYTIDVMEQYGHALFWTRVVNKTEQILELDLHFPADSFTVYPSPHAHFKLLVPTDTMTLDKVTAYGFGFDDVQNFVNHNFYQPSQLKRTIEPNEETIFYVVLLSHLPTSDQGISRTGLFLKDKVLFYRLISPSGIKLMSCGSINFKE